MSQRPNPPRGQPRERGRVRPGDGASWRPRADPEGGASWRRLGRALASEDGQSLPLVLGAAFVVLLAAAILTAFGGAVSGAATAQRGADLAALSAVRSMRDDLPRLTAPARLSNGRPNPRHLGRAPYLARAVGAAREAAARNGPD